MGPLESSKGPGYRQKEVTKRFFIGAKTHGRRRRSVWNERDSQLRTATQVIGIHNKGDRMKIKPSYLALVLTHALVISAAAQDAYVYPAKGQSEDQTERDK